MNRPPINARIRLLGDSHESTVTSHTERGFTYEYDEPIPFGRAAWGQQTTGGEHFVDVYPELRTWELAPTTEANTDERIDQWHALPEDGQPLHEYLGLTWDQYAHWAQYNTLPTT